jgi:hypothetical protein
MTAAAHPLKSQPPEEPYLVRRCQLWRRIAVSDAVRFGLDGGQAALRECG